MILYLEVTMDVTHIWKRIGESPLQAMERARTNYNFPPNLRGCYTGRLDPLAQGEMAVLWGDKVHLSHSYNGRDKTYRFQAHLGVSTTSYDVFGRITNIRPVTSVQADQFVEEILKLNQASDQTIEQVLPPASAYRYKGKPLWQHAKEGTLPDPLPTKKVKMYQIKTLQAHPTKISMDSHRIEALDDINDFQKLNPNADFDYTNFIGDWTDLHEGQIEYFYRICLEATVGSGTFVRSLVYDTATKLGIPAHAFRITRIGQSYTRQILGARS